MGSEWYVLRDGEKYGPFSSDRMNAGVRDGELRREDLVWREGMPDWRPAGDVMPFRAMKGSVALSPQKSKTEDAQPPKATDARAAPKLAVRVGASKRLSAAEIQKRGAASKRLLFKLGEVLSVFMRVPAFRVLPLGDIRALVVPPMSAGQFLVAEARTKRRGVVTPVAVALWAKVSKEVDRRLSESLDKPVRLAPDEWKSGEIAWLVALAGHQRAIAPMLRKFQKTTLKGQPLKMRAKGKDGKTIVTTFSGRPG